MSFGGQIADLGALGWLPRQHFDPNWPIEARIVTYSARVKRDQDDQNALPEIDVLPNGDLAQGDDQGSFFWERQGTKRPHGSFWESVVPSVVLADDGDEDENVNPSVSATVTRTRKKSKRKVVPLRAVDTPDDRYAPHEFGLPDWATKFPGDWTGLKGRGSEEYSQEETWHPDFLGLVASNRGEPELGSRVFETDGEKLDTVRWAYLQSALSVIDMGAEGRALALQLGSAGRGGGPGRALFIDYDLREVAYGSMFRGGPFTTGGPSCTHSLGATPDAFTRRPLHFQTGALFINAVGDGPLFFESTPYDPEEIQQGVPTRVHLRWDALTKVWRWQTYNPLWTPPPWVDPDDEELVQPDPTRPLPPGGNPPPVPGGEVGGVPSGPTTPNGPGGFFPPTRPGVPIGYPGGVVIGTTPGGGLVGTTGPYGGGSLPTAPVDDGPILPDDLRDELRDAGLETYYGAVNGQTPTVGAGGYKPAYPHSWTHLVLPGLFIKGYATSDGEHNLTGSLTATEEQRKNFQRAPNVAHITGWAFGDGTWQGFEHYTAGSPQTHPMAGGGAAFLPPDVELPQVLSGEATTQSQTFLTFPDGLSGTAWGQPTQTSGGTGVAGGVVAYGAGGALVFGTTDGQGVVNGTPLIVGEGGITTDKLTADVIDPVVIVMDATAARPGQLIGGFPPSVGFWVLEDGVAAGQHKAYFFDGVNDVEIGGSGGSGTGTGAAWRDTAFGDPRAGTTGNLSVTVPAGTLAATGDYLRIVASGHSTSAATSGLYVGPSGSPASVGGSTHAGTGDPVYLEIRLWRTGASDWQAIVRYYESTGLVTDGTVKLAHEAAEEWGGNWDSDDIVVTLSQDSGSFIPHFLEVEAFRP